MRLQNPMITLRKTQMDILRMTLTLALLVQPAAVFGLHASPSSVQSRASEELGVCKVESLPLDIRELLKEEFELGKVQESTNLSVAARQRWKSEDPLECPGIAVGQFENVKLLSYAVLLVPRSHFDRGYKLVVFSPRAGRTTYESRVVEQSARSSAVDFFIH